MLIVVLYTHGAWHSPVPRASCQIDLIFFPIFVPVPSQDLDFSVFPIPHVMVSFVVNVLRWVAVVSFVGTGGIVDHFCLNFPYLTTCPWDGRMPCSMGVKDNYQHAPIEQ
jgi:hypothetical protein